MQSWQSGCWLSALCANSLGILKEHTSPEKVVTSPEVVVRLAKVMDFVNRSRLSWFSQSCEVVVQLVHDPLQHRMLTSPQISMV